MFTSGCSVLESHADQTNFFKTIPASNGKNSAQIISIDAKQRIIIEKLEKDRSSSNTSSREVSLIRMYCAEPSPDALSATVGTLAAAYNKSSGTSVSLGKTLIETAQNIGLRTQSIQLMRDAMYRNCEGYFSGALSRSQFDQALTRFQILMSGLLAIEQFTGAVVVPPATGSPQSKIAVLKLTEAQEKLLLALKEDKMMLEDNRKIAAEKSASTKVAEIDKMIEVKKEEIGRITETFDFLRAERRKVLLGSLVSDVSNNNLNQWRATVESVKAIATAVTTISQATLNSIAEHDKFMNCSKAVGTKQEKIKVLEGVEEDISHTPVTFTLSQSKVDQINAFAQYVPTLSGIIDKEVRSQTGVTPAEVKLTLTEDQVKAVDKEVGDSIKVQKSLLEELKERCFKLL